MIRGDLMSLFFRPKNQFVFSFKVVVVMAILKDQGT